MEKKGLFLALLALVVFNVTFSQQVNRNLVVLEMGTATWCSSCPQAAIIADDMVNNGYDIAVIEYHGSDPYSTPASEHRITDYYGITGLPTSVFDGLTQIEGSYPNSASLYEQAYNNAISVMSDFTLGINFTQSVDTYSVTVDMEKVAGGENPNLVLHLTLNESHIPEEWGVSPVLYEVNYVNRAMYPDQNGTPLDFSSTTSITETFTITPDPSWDTDYVELVAFIQDNETKAILQATKIPLVTEVGSNNAKLVKILEPEGNYCRNNISPQIKFRNKGSEILTSLDIAYDINGEISGATSWTGSLEFNSSEIIDLEELYFNQLDTNTITITLSNPNGAIDDDPSDNQQSKDFYKSIYGVGPLTLVINTDGWGEECTWEIMDSEGTVVESGGPYGNNTTETITLTLEEGCHTFHLYDSYGDGGGEVSITDMNAEQIFFTDGSYGSGISAEFGYEASTMAPTMEFNPADSATGVAIDTDISLTFNMPVRNLDNSPITDPASLISLKLDNANGSNVAFSATLNNDATVITIIPDANLNYDQTYYIEISDQLEGDNDMQFAGASASFTTETIGISAIDESKVSVYPNPVSSELTVMLNNGATGIIDIELYDITGSIVYKREHEISSKITINVSEITSGIYFLNIKNEELNITRKINVVKQ